ncbi:MAG: hypothetical protein IKS35_08780 [Clostridia bacterium]|nr:hypothetical protein [Clostridia bacterium]
MTTKDGGIYGKKAQEKTAEIIPVTIDTKDVKSLIHVMQNRFDVTSFENGSAVISSFCFAECLGYADTFFVY